MTAGRLEYRRRVTTSIPIIRNGPLSVADGRVPRERAAIAQD